MAATCYNCRKDATYFVRDSWASPVDYCGDCFPSSYRRRAKAGETFPEPKVTSKRASAPVDE